MTNCCGVTQHLPKVTSSCYDWTVNYRSKHNEARAVYC